MQDRKCTPQEGFKIEGTVSDDAFEWDRVARDAEQRSIVRYMVVYHYFEGSEEIAGSPLAQIVMAEGRVASRARCMTREEIERSIGTRDPHYGDGAYISLHSDLHNAHHEVQAAHGVHVASRRYRAVFRVRDPERFRTFRRTGGVGRTIPREEELTTGQLIFLGGEGDLTATYLFTEKYENGRWERLGR